MTLSHVENNKALVYAINFVISEKLENFWKTRGNRNNDAFFHYVAN